MFRWKAVSDQICIASAVFQVEVKEMLESWGFFLYANSTTLSTVGVMYCLVFMLAVHSLKSNSIFIDIYTKSK